MARIDVIMPQMGESIAEGTISRWMKKVGDPIKRDEPIFEISTDKVDAEIPAPTAGTLAEILVQEGQTVAVQAIVARIETEAGAVAAAPAPAPAAAPAPAPAAAPAPAPAPAARRRLPRRRRRRSGGTRRAAPLQRRRRDARGAPSPPLDAAGAQDRRGARTRHLDHRRFRHGRPGHEERRDRLHRGAARRRGPRRGARSAPRRRLRRPRPPPAAPASTPGYPAADPWEGDRTEPWSRIRKLTAEHMIMSRRTSAHVATFFEIDYSRVATLRAKKKAEYAERGVNLTFLAFIAKAVADSLRKHPVVNAAVGHETTIYRRDINLGIAVALDWGLIVPVIKHADELSMLGLARSISDLADRARSKKLSPDEVQKGTFTITNPGVFGSMIGIPIINQPQVAILAVGSITKQPAVMTVDGADTLGIRTKGMLSLSFDHRVVDGSDADRFMADVKKAIETFAEGAV